MTSQLLAKIIESMPQQGIDFEYCAVQQVEKRTFTLANSSASLVHFEVSMDDTNEQSFKITPRNGMMKSGAKQEFTVTFAPTEAKVTITSAVFVFQEGSRSAKKVLKMSGIGKYPFVEISTDKIDFEALTVGTSACQNVTFRNYSQVRAQYTIELVNDDGKDKSIVLNKYKGLIEPAGSDTITATFLPTIVGMCTSTQFKIDVAGGNELKLTCKGESQGIDVMLSSKSIQFGEVQAESATNRLLNIMNQSDQPTTFQFFNDRSNVFSFSKTEGTIQPHSQCRIIIEFYPQQTKSYYERVFCVVRNHQVLCVDLIGTCYDVLTKPMPLMQRHVDIYRHKVIMGIHTRQRKDKMGDAGLGDLDLGGSQRTGKGDETGGEDRDLEDKISMTNLSAADLEMNQEIPIDDPSQVVLHKEMLIDITSETRDVRVSADFLDFNFAESGRFSDSKSVTVFNKFPFPVDVDWALLKVMNTTTGQWVKNPFRVRPAEAKIEANSQKVFSVDFAPFEPDQYFFQQAQCYVTLNNGALSKNKRLIAQEEQKQAKQQRAAGGSLTKTKTLLGSMKRNKYEGAINEDIDPPLCLNLRFVGHSFPPGSQPFIPMIKLNPSNQLVFPSCGPNESVYQTIQLVNTSDTPAYYKILQDPTHTYTAYPHAGLIQGKAFGLVCLQFNPKAPRDYNFIAQFIFNHNPSNVHKVSLVGHCYEPSLRLSNDSKLFFPPIYKGVSTKQSVMVQNQSRIPLQYEWKVPDKYKSEIKFAPQKAYLLPNEECKIVATFTALKKKDYHITVPIYARNIYDHVKNSVGFCNPGSGLMHKNSGLPKNALMPQSHFIKKYTLEVIGRGSDGVIQIQPQAVDFGTITVGFNKTLQATVYNRSNCNIFIELKMAPKNEKQGGKTKYSQSELSTLTKVLGENFHFDTPKGIINAKSKKMISITFKPQLRFDFDINMVCIARERMDKEVLNKVSSTKYQEAVVEKSFITVQAKGDYPLLRFEDVRNDQESIANLWERFNMTKMNKDLLNPLNESEKVFNNSDQTNQSMDELVRNLTSFNWDFGKIPIRHARARKVTLTMKNIGGVEAKWLFKLPNDSEIELEPWADPGEPTPEKAFEKHILDNKIFDVHPRKGVLQPGDQMELNVFYYPKEVKRHHLKTFLQIANGKPLIINLQGETLHRRAYMRLLKDIYHLPPTPIGLDWAVTYPIEMKNLGITKLNYSIDTTQLEALNSNNYDFRIFEIQNPEGKLAPNDTQYIYTLFRPLEAKDYAVDLPIKISDIEGPSDHQHVLKLRGKGYHPEAVEKIPKEVKFYEDLPKCRAFVGEDGQMAAFSYESIDFGELEASQISNRFVILYNMHGTQKLKFEFQKSGLMCGDNLKLEPMSGELEPGSHQNIKMTLIPARFPTNFEGEIQCSIDWEPQGDEEKAEMKSLHTHTHMSDSQEFLFLRLKKRSKFKKETNPIESRENETLYQNVINEMMNDILHDKEMDELLDNCFEASGGIFNQIVTSDHEPPSTNTIYQDLEEPQVQQIGSELEVYRKNLKELTGNDDHDIDRKQYFTDKLFTDMLEYMLEDTMFNLMEEATYEEFDLMQAPKIYIRKDQIDKK